MARRLHFPSPDSADPTGLVAITKELSTELLLEAYGRGIFPWSEHPVRWYSPDPRAVFLPEYTKVPKKMGKIMRRHGYRVSFDTAFESVMQACSDAHRESGEWISEGFVREYAKLHALGYAHSVEVWQGDTLVGGLYGVQLGGMFAGESMFHRTPNASKVAFAHLVHHLTNIGVPMIDAQVLNEHTHSLGAVQIHRHDFMQLLRHCLRLPARYVGEKWPPDPIWRPDLPPKQATQSPEKAPGKP